MRSVLLLLCLTATGARAEPGKHWAFQPVPAVMPPVDPERWSESAIDCFIAAKWRERGLIPVQTAEPRTLIRRLFYDLIGLPPTPAEVTDFVAATKVNPAVALERLVERLLASPHYGERWGRYWMDVVRYADTAGDNADYPIPEAHLYRDYIIDSFNADKPYDQFVHEQIAGDLLALAGPPERYAEQVIATGFLALSRRYLTAPYEMWHLTLENTIETLGTTFLGLNLRCARCHHHKFDPVTIEDYYGLYGFFAATTFPFAGSEEFASMQKYRQNFAALVPPAEAKARLRAYQARLQHLQSEVDTSNRLDAFAKQEPALAPVLKFFERTRHERRSQAAAELNYLRRRGAPADLPVAYAVSDNQPVEVKIHRAGDPDQPGAPAPRSVPLFLSGKVPLVLPASGSGRLELARWLTRSDHPLTARVLVNRIWQHHFGRGLVATPSNFGANGERPTHPELLDWLAQEFVKSGWSIKTLHRKIVLSKTYRLASAHHPANADRDPANRFLWQYQRRRLDAEALRDSLLAVSGNLDRRRPGAQPFPPIATWGWTQHNPFKEVYEHRHRSVYLMTQRIQRHPFLALFDGPDANTSTEARTTSTVPLQALYWLNHPFTKEQAAHLAQRVLRSTGGTDKRIVLAQQLVYGRDPRPDELTRGRSFVERYQVELSQVGMPAAHRELEAWISYCRVLLTANEFVFVE